MKHTSREKKAAPFVARGYAMVLDSCRRWSAVETRKGGFDTLQEAYDAIEDHYYWKIEQDGKVILKPY